MPSQGYLCLLQGPGFLRFDLPATEKSLNSTFVFFLVGNLIFNVLNLKLALLCPPPLPFQLILIHEGIRLAPPPIFASSLHPSCTFQSDVLILTSSTHLTRVKPPLQI